jgi:hypothetical protein
VKVEATASTDASSNGSDCPSRPEYSTVIGLAATLGAASRRATSDGSTACTVVTDDG